jgi:2-dehydro-3-deoxygalactonokinase
MNDVVLLGVDWGSSSVRAFAIANDGAAAAVKRADDGVFTGSGPFGARLRGHLGDWLERWPHAPVLLCGMVGSDRGWVHAPYVAAPAGLSELAGALVPAPFECSARIVPGVSFTSGETCEVLRGEETLLMGLGERASGTLVCLPGTHSKWADLADGRIAGFRTYMTGELRALLLSQGALATTITQIDSHDAFLAGLAAAREDAAPTRALFQARARRLLGRLAPQHTASFVSGILIGAEIACEAGAAAVLLAARGDLAAAYSAALREARIAVSAADPEPLAASGLLRIAVAAGLVRADSM